MAKPRESPKRKRALARLRWDILACYHFSASLGSPAQLQRHIGDGQIVSAEYSVSKTDNVMTVTLRAQCTENIAKEADSD